MKKNITLNLCGRLFNIDEDAYEMLSTYEQSLRSYFRSREGGEEIADDIEARIAELMDELKAQGKETVSIEDITGIIQRIGKPEEMDGPSTDSSPEGEGDRRMQEAYTSEAFPFGESGRGAKRLYRDPYDKKVSGVLSGFAAYFGGDVLWWRIGYVGAILLCFFGSSFNFLWWLPGHHFFFNIQFWGFGLIIAYIVLSILMPVAWSPEERLRMKGKPVNPQNLAEEVSHPQSVQESTEGLKGCIGGGIFIIGTLFRWCVYAIGAFVVVMCILGIVSLAGFALNPTDIVDLMNIPQPNKFTDIMLTLKTPFYVFIFSAITVLSVTVYAIIHSILNEFKQMPPMPYPLRITLLTTWIVGLIMVGCSISYGIPKFIKAQKCIDGTIIELIDDETDYYIGNVENKPNYSKGKGWLIQNKGLGNLRIDSTYVSNDCVKLFFPRSKEVGPNEYLPIRAMLDPEKEQQGDFVYTIKVFGNFPESPLVFSIAGTFQIPDTTAVCN